ERTLAAENQRLPFEPMDHRALLGTTGEPTIGGVAAANVSGPRRIQAGACRDSMIGLRFVDGQGQVLRNGGRVMKNVTGYDLVKLLAGSRGTLGVLTQVAFKVLPATAAQATVMIEGLSDASAVDAMCRALASPFEVSGAAHMPQGPDGTPLTLLRVEGFENSVKYRAGRLHEMLGALGPMRDEADPEASAALWKSVRDAEAFAGTPGDVWRLSVVPTEAAAIATRLGAGRLLYDWGGGLIWAELAPGTDLRARLGPFEGHATLVRASAETRKTLPVFQPEPAPLDRIAAGLRQRFDPRNLLNPGLMA
ncbi:FAD-binding protein, partial [Brevirhabdus pacifica]